MAKYGPTFHRTSTETFEAQVQGIVDNTEAKILAIFREGVQRTVDIAQTPTAKGGRMHVDTGFLRASGQGSLNGMPTGPTRNESGAPVTTDDASVVLALANMKIGDTFFFGWTANYAKYREYQDGFLRLAAQQWPQTIEAVAAEARKRNGS